jgi:hypothetical protein
MRDHISWLGLQYEGQGIIRRNRSLMPSHSKFPYVSVLEETRRVEIGVVEMA